MQSDLDVENDAPESASKRRRWVIIIIWGVLFLSAAIAIYDRAKKQLNIEAAKIVSAKLETIKSVTGIAVNAQGLEPGLRTIDIAHLEIILPRKRFRTTLTQTNINKTLELLRQVEPALNSLALYLTRPKASADKPSHRIFSLQSFLPRRMVFDIKQITIHVAPENRPEERETLLEADEFHIRIHPHRRRINFHAQEIQVTGLPREQMVGGHIKIHQSTGDVELLAFKTPDSRAHSWGVQINGLPQAQKVKARVFGTHMPAIIAGLLNTKHRGPISSNQRWSDIEVLPSNDTTFETSIAIAPLGREMVSFEFALNFRDLFVRHGKLAHDEIGPLHMDSEITGTLDPATFEVIVDHGRIELPTPLDFEAPDRTIAQRSRFDFNVAGGLEPAIILNFRGRGPITPPASVKKLMKSRFPPRSVRVPPQKWSVEAFVARTPCQALIDVIPPRMAPAVGDFSLTGEFMGMLNLTWPVANPQDFQFKLSHNEFDCDVESAPEALQSDKLSQPLRISRSSDGMVRREILLGPGNPDFTPLAGVSRHFINAIIAAEDAGFWRHNGLDLYSFVDAIRDNVTAGRIARGGSTITMQLVKNILLSKERTASRKIQEYFLAWYIGGRISHERILEIYANAVEFGPDIFGIGEAARLYFNKSPSRLSLRESLFLTNLLPAPVSRSAAYCRRFQPTENQSALMNQLLKRMIRLKLVTPGQANEARIQPLQFNTSPEATRQVCHPDRDAT